MAPRWGPALRVLRALRARPHPTRGTAPENIAAVRRTLCSGSGRRCSADTGFTATVWHVHPIDDRTYAVLYGIFAVAVGLALNLANRPITRYMLKGQFKDPDAQKYQWFYPFTRALGWFFVAFGLLLPVLVFAGVLTGADHS